MISVQLLSPSEEDIKLIKLLINTSNPELAAKLTNREFPLLRGLAKLITGGYKFSMLINKIAHYLSS